MPEFDRRAAILAELDSLDDDTTAQLAGITFVTQEDHATLRLLRESIAEEYRTGRAETRDRYPVARAVGEDVAGRGHQMARFASISDIDTLPTTATAFDPGAVQIAEDMRIGEIVAAALTLRLSQAAYELLGYLEDDADTKEADHPDDHTA